VALDLMDGSPLLSSLVHPDLRPLRTTYEGDFGEPLGDIYYFPQAAAATGRIPAIHRTTTHRSGKVETPCMGSNEGSERFRGLRNVEDIQGPDPWLSHCGDASSSSSGCSSSIRMEGSPRNVAGALAGPTEREHSRSNPCSRAASMLRRYASLAWNRVSRDSNLLAFGVLGRQTSRAPSHMHGHDSSDTVRLRSKQDGEVVGIDGQRESDENVLHKEGSTGSQGLKGVLLCFPRHYHDTHGV
jgi:hypothetical protein